MAAQYIDKRGRILFVGEGLGDAWATYYRARGKESFYFSSHRVVSKYLPVRRDPADAQRDLDAWAKKNKLVRHDG